MFSGSPPGCSDWQTGGVEQQTDHQLIIAACQSLARLHRRLFAASLDPKLIGPLGNQHLDAWRVGELDPPSEWLQGVRPELAVVNVASRSGEVLEALLALLATGRPDRLQVCLLLQHVAVEATAWTGPVRRLAARWSLTLPATPQDAPVWLPPPVAFRRSR